MESSCLFISKSDTETQSLARKLAQLVKEGDVIALEGDLGAGKTTFAKGFAEGLGIAESIESPTFTIIKEYDGVVPLYHMDVYRLEAPEDELGLEDYFYGDGICLVEWASQIKEVMPEETIWIEILVREAQIREIHIKAKNHRYVEPLCKELEKL